MTQATQGAADSHPCSHRYAARLRLGGYAPLRLRFIGAFAIICGMESSGTIEHEATSALRSVCHGSSVIVERPRIVRTKYTKDFGYGFYCTILRERRGGLR